MRGRHPQPGPISVGKLRIAVDELMNYCRLA
jgi:hypothetical protein